MSYVNPNIITITNPKGIDKTIQEIQGYLASVTWLEKIFGRAMVFNELSIDKKTLKIPKCYNLDKEYYPVLPNGNFKAMSFVKVNNSEKYDNYMPNLGSLSRSREASLIIWGNLREINSSKDYIFTEELKKDIELSLINCESVKINNYFDEKAEEIFSGYSLTDVNTQYLMYPYFGMRFDLTLTYKYSLC